MLDVYRVLVFININLILIQCSIPSLNVQRIDKRLIARKRQDTLDMCRIFTNENEKLNKEYTKRPYYNGGKRRVKRDIGPVNAADVENARRFETIVDKLYEDVVEDGEPVTYRRRNLDTTTEQGIKNKTMRRFNFAPAELLGPLSTKEPKGFDPSSGDVTGIDWPKKWKHGIVPYFIDAKTYDAHLADIIMKAFDYFEKVTCIRLQRLKDRPTDKQSLQHVEWLYITNPSGIKQCVHSNEKKTNKGVQMVVFGYDCLSLGEIIHEVMHILGFSHEHTRPDRDHHISILWNNIKPGYKKFFEIRNYDPLLNIPYDHASVLHYPPRAFSKNGQITLMTQAGVKIGQREGLSEGDVEKVAVIYGSECMQRNRQYLLQTCPSVVKAETRSYNVTQDEIKDYFRERLWPYGTVNYKIKDDMEFSAEERENIRAVIRHIEKETCIKFRDIKDAEQESDNVNIDNDEKSNSDENNDKDRDENNEGKVSDNHQSENDKQDIEEDNENNDKNQDDNKETTVLDNQQSENNKKDNEKGTDTENGIQSDATTRPQSNDSENEVKHGDDTNDNINTSSNKTGIEMALRKGTAMPRPALERSPKYERKSQRRHASDILVLTRSPEPGCVCPTPGKPNGNQVLKINADCFNSVNDLLHLFVHVLGLDHQHNMHDRDSYLRILWDNLTPDVKNEMSKKLPPAASVGFDYDYQSVMHYPWLQIKDGVTNIMYPIWNDGWAMGHWQGLSSTDVNKLNVLYHEQCYERTKSLNLQ